MKQDGRQSVSTQSTQGQTGLGPDTVVQPTEAVKQDLQPMQPVRPTVVVSQFEPTTAERPDGKQELVTPPQAIPKSRSDIFPIGMSASQLGLDMQKNHIHIDWRKRIRNGIYPVAILLVIVGGLLFWKYDIDGMATKTTTIGGYTYSFSFFRSATYEQVSSSGFQGYTVNNEIAATVRPQSTNLVQYCSELGSQYTQAFTVTVYGASRPVCTAQDNLGTQVYYLGFSALNKNHGFAVTYNKSQNSKVYPKLKSIFESVKVSKQ